MEYFVIFVIVFILYLVIDFYISYRYSKYTIGIVIDVRWNGDSGRTGAYDAVYNFKVNGKQYKGSSSFNNAEEYIGKKVVVSYLMFYPRDNGVEDTLEVPDDFEPPKEGWDKSPPLKEGKIGNVKDKPTNPANLLGSLVLDIFWSAK